MKAIAQTEVPDGFIAVYQVTLSDGSHVYDIYFISNEPTANTYLLNNAVDYDSALETLDRFREVQGNTRTLAA